MLSEHWELLEGHVVCVGVCNIKSCFSHPYTQTQPLRLYSGEHVFVSLTNYKTEDKHDLEAF